MAKVTGNKVHFRMKFHSKGGRQSEVFMRLFLIWALGGVHGSVSVVV